MKTKVRRLILVPLDKNPGHPNAQPTGDGRTTARQRDMERLGNRRYELRDTETGELVTQI